MIPVAWLDRIEQDLFEALTPVWYAPAAFWLGACHAEQYRNLEARFLALANA